MGSALESGKPVSSFPRFPGSESPGAGACFSHVGWAAPRAWGLGQAHCRWPGCPASGVTLTSAPPFSSSQIYEAQPDVSRAFQTREFIPLPRLLAMVMVTTVPPVCNKIMFTQALNVSACLASRTFSCSSAGPTGRAGL